MRQAALLRGVNLGKRKVIMSELRALCEGAGYSGVQTLLASGNLVLDARAKGAKLESALEALIQQGLGLKTDVFVRTSAQLDAVIAANPFKSFARTQPSFLIVAFMRGSASRAELEAIQKTALLGEEAKQGKNCLYIRFPVGQGPSKLKLPSLAPARQWTTVTQLAAMARRE